MAVLMCRVGPTTAGERLFYLSAATDTTTPKQSCPRDLVRPARTKWTNIPLRRRATHLYRSFIYSLSTRALSSRPSTLHRQAANLRGFAPGVRSVRNIPSRIRGTGCSATCKARSGSRLLYVPSCLVVLLNSYYIQWPGYDPARHSFEKRIVNAGKLSRGELLDVVCGAVVECLDVLEHTHCKTRKEHAKWASAHRVDTFLVTRLHHWGGKDFQPEIWVREE